MMLNSRKILCTSDVTMNYELYATCSSSFEFLCNKRRSGEVGLRLRRYYPRPFERSLFSKILVKWCNGRVST